MFFMEIDHMINYNEFIVDSYLGNVHLSFYIVMRPISVGHKKSVRAYRILGAII